MDIESEAKLQGWSPLEDFKGDQSKWVDAETYVERGKQILPLLQANNKRLLNELDSVKSVVKTLTQTVATQTESMEEFKKFHQESSKAQVDKARKELLSELKAAKSEGDIDQEIKLTSDLSEFDAARREVKQIPQKDLSPPPQEAKTSEPPPLPEEIKEWLSENKWYSQDEEKTDLIDAIASRLQRQNPTLKGKDFLNEAKRVMEERLGASEPVNKVASSTRSEGTSYGNVSSYNQLPSDAKAVCDKQAEKYVGAHLIYKTKKEWQEAFVTEYNKVH